MVFGSSTTLFKLAIFTLALGVLPLTSYFGSLHYVWEGNATYAAITAIVAANVVLVAYIITSVLEDQQSTPSSASSAQETKKTR
ncbi:hypothetical protein ONZ45_g42 [Pleurotus djamor]|nr:hypothetical protein ONZ45_g42 [Pleurotus djamor]